MCFSRKFSFHGDRVIPIHLLLERRDRSVDDNVHVSDVLTSDSAKRSRRWSHSHTGPIYVCNWYRLGNSSDDVLDIIHAELSQASRDSVGAIIKGDLSLHRRMRLRFPSVGTPAGTRMGDSCDESDLQQLVREATRSDNLLDFV